MDTIINIFSEYWIFLLPLIILQLTLQIFALLHIQKYKKYPFASKGVWITVVLLFQILGPVIYFSLGKGEE